MNGVYFYFVNKLFLVGRYWDFKKHCDIKTNCSSDDQRKNLSFETNLTHRLQMLLTLLALSQTILGFNNLAKEAVRKQYEKRRKCC